SFPSCVRAYMLRKDRTRLFRARTGHQSCLAWHCPGHRLNLTWTSIPLSLMDAALLNVQPLWRRFVELRKRKDAVSELRFPSWDKHLAASQQCRSVEETGGTKIVGAHPVPVRRVV